MYMEGRNVLHAESSIQPLKGVDRMERFYDDCQHCHGELCVAIIVNDDGQIDETFCEDCGKSPMESTPYII